MDVLVKRKTMKILLCLVLLILLMLYLLMMYVTPDSPYRDPKEVVRSNISITVTTKMWAIVQNNSFQKELVTDNTRSFGKGKGPVLSHEYLHMLRAGDCDKNINNSYELIPDKNSWIPRKMCKTFSGPYYINLENGKEVPYTNYTFMPLTLYSQYLLNNPNICKDITQNLTFLILVHSAVHYFDKRKAMRETWANPMLLKERISRVVFIVGRTRNQNIQRHLEDEERIHKDIVQGDFIDDYHNLTHKAVLGHRWVQEHCQNTKFVLKVDDDVMINIFKVIEDVLPIFSNSSHTIVCRVRRTVPIGRNDRWAVSYDYFPNYGTFPFDFCPGAFALMPPQTSLMLFQAAHVTPFFWLDDVYVYGILTKIANLRLHHIDGLYNREKGASKCFNESRPCPNILVLTSKPESMYFYWKKIVEQQNDLISKYAYTDQILTMN